MAGTNTITCADREMLLGFKHGVISCADEAEVVIVVTEATDAEGNYTLVVKDKSDMEDMSLHLDADGIHPL